MQIISHNRIAPPGEDAPPPVYTEEDLVNITWKWHARNVITDDSDMIIIRGKGNWRPYQPSSAPQAISNKKFMRSIRRHPRPSAPPRLLLNLPNQPPPTLPQPMQPTLNPMGSPPLPCPPYSCTDQTLTTWNLGTPAPSKRTLDSSQPDTLTPTPKRLCSTSPPSPSLQTPPTPTQTTMDLTPLVLLTHPHPPNLSVTSQPPLLLISLPTDCCPPPHASTTSQDHPTGSDMTPYHPSSSVSPLPFPPCYTLTLFSPKNPNEIIPHQEPYPSPTHPTKRPRDLMDPTSPSSPHPVAPSAKRPRPPHHVPSALISPPTRKRPHTPLSHTSSPDTTLHPHEPPPKRLCHTSPTLLTLPPPPSTTPPMPLLPISEPSHITTLLLLLPPTLPPPPPTTSSTPMTPNPVLTPTLTPTPPTPLPTKRKLADLSIDHSPQNTDAPPIPHCLESPTDPLPSPLTHLNKRSRPDS